MREIKKGDLKMENLDKKTLRRMDACFKYLTNPDDWRDPICKNVIVLRISIVEIVKTKIC